MLFVRVLLTLILMASILWGSLIAFGPVFIGWAAKILTSGELRLDSITVEPDLTIRIPRAELRDKDEKIWAFSRGLEVTWSFHDGRFNIDVHTGPTASTNQGYASGLKLNVQPNAFTDWSSVELRHMSEDIQLGDEALIAGRLHASAIYMPPTNVLQSSSWMFESLTQPEFGIDISEVFFETPRLSLDAELPLNEVLENLIVRQINIPKVGATIESASVHLDETAAVPQLEIIGHNFSSDYFEVTADTVRFTTQLLTDQNLEAPHKLLIEGIRTSDALLGDLSANYANVGASDFEVSGALNIANFKLNVRNVYVGDFAGSTFNFLAQSKSLGDSKSVIGSITGNVGTKSELTSAAVFEVSRFDQSCLLTECEVERILIKSEISADDEKLSGVSECVNEACLNFDFSHQFRTENTNRLLRNIQNTNIFSPLAIFGVRALIKQSPQDGAGHIINF